MILGIDTSIGTAVAVVDLDGAVRAEAASADPRGHAEVIGTLIADALATAGVTPAEITHVAVGMGPGPFTGLRVGIAAARAFALGRGIPVVPVVSHDAAALARGDAAEPFAVVTDARRREVAFSVYAPGSQPRRMRGPELAARSGEVAIDGLVLAEEELTTAISAADLARVAAGRIAAGEQDAAASEPLYLRAPDVTIPAARKKVGA
ncbi:tRNA (adenosine(37)-N6)-threonylcarbamoyltransferase complex dimerization subunit type 1 TsaB [Microbacterium sp.]|uniref:tRNA (adenosine(37)-N6)-threonylcarbamoyltransferase complex dimerization subunit type 1 TsaB n=1 Tax=Microbacterium sp. TaxID=51671 RepID=UPI0039E65533